MSRAARRMLVGCMAALLVVMFAGVAGAQENAALTPREGVTWGAPPELRDKAVVVWRLIRERKFDEARAICQQAYDSTTDPEVRVIALRGIGEAYKEEYFMDRAIEIFKQVIAQYPQSGQVSWAKLSTVESYIYKAEVSQPKENIALAMPILDGFIKDYPNHERAEGALKFRAWCHEQLGDDQAALADYQKAVDLYPQHRWSNGCLMRAIELLQKLGRWDEAVASAQRYIKLYPDRHPASAQLSIGMSYALKGDLAGAVREFDKVVSEYPADKGRCAMALHQKASCLKSLGQPAAARATLEQLARDYPDSYQGVRASEDLESYQ